MSVSQQNKAGENPIEALLRGATSVFVYIGIFSFFINLLMLVGPLYMMQIYDRVLISHSIDTLIFLTIAAVGLIATGAILEYVRSLVLTRLAGRMDAKINDAMFSQLLSASLAVRAAGQAQPLRDMETVRSFMTGNGLVVFFDAPWTPVFLAIVFLMHPLLGSIALVGALTLFGLALLSEIMTRKPLKTAAGHSIQAMNFAESSMRNAEVIEAMGMLDGIKGRWLKEHNKAMALQSLATDKGATVKSAIKFVRPVLQIAILGTGAFLALNQEITPGVMIGASIIMGRALAPVEMAVGNWRGFVLARASYGRLKGFLGSWKARSDMPLPRPKGDISVEKLVGMPPGTRKPIVKGISFQIKAGEALGIIGPSAAGKSTLARLLVGVWKPASGHVRLDGADISSWDHIQLGPHLGYLPQDVELFDGTIAENIARFAEPDPDAVIEAAKLAGVHDMVLRLENGYDTRIGEAGAILSGGQRQRLGLARAVYNKPALIILDEPNSNLDGEGEEALKRALTALKAHGTTVIIVAHRPSIVSVLDTLLVMRDGTIDQFGPLKEILPKVTKGAGQGQRKVAAKAGGQAPAPGTPPKPGGGGAPPSAVAGASG